MCPTVCRAAPTCAFTLNFTTASADACLRASLSPLSMARKVYVLASSSDSCNCRNRPRLISSTARLCVCSTVSITVSGVVLPMIQRGRDLIKSCHRVKISGAESFSKYLHYCLDDDIVSQEHPSSFRSKHPRASHSTWRQKLHQLAETLVSAKRCVVAYVKYKKAVCQWLLEHKYPRTARLVQPY